MKNTLARGGSLVATTALAATLAYAPTASAAVIPTPSGSDPSPAAVGGAYLAAQPGTNGIIHTYYDASPPYPAGDYDDYGLTIDAATALDAVGGQSAKVAALTSAIEAQGDAYTTSFGTTYANAAGKLASFLLAQGRSGAATNSAVQKVEQSVNQTAPKVGRIQDLPYDATYDSASPLGQSYAARALNAAGSPDANEVLQFLLRQQCSAGYFRESFTKDNTTTNPPTPATDQTCDGAPTAQKVPSVDTTAFTVLNLQSQRATSIVAASLTSAVNWLATQQAADGSFGGGNANTTGLAGWALGVSGNTGAAAKAASWLRARQLANAGTCRPYAVKDNGALTLDDLGYKNASSGPLDNIDNSTATRATAQALPALLWAPGGTKSGETDVTPVKEYRFVKAGSRQAVNITGAPGNTICVTQGTTSTRVVLPPSGSVPFVVNIPQTDGTTTISTVDAGGEADSYSYDTLGAKKLRLKTAKRLHRGDSALITVKGLAPKEKVRVLIGKKIVRRGHANSHGVFKRHFAVNYKTGRATLKVLGQFGGLRNDSEKIRVVR